MDVKHAAVIILSVVAVLIVAVYLEAELEGFSSKEQKAEAIYKWFLQNPNPNYNKYKVDLTKQSNIVEYEDIFKLKQTGNFTLDKVIEIV